jgi:hypothetical protein
MVPVPDMTQIPGDTPVCSPACFPVGEDAETWAINEEATRKP